MKRTPFIAALGVVSLLVGCASAPVAVAPVGPNPAIEGSPGGTGQLEVFSALAGHSEGNNPSWHQHTDYTVYTLQGTVVQHVGNTIGHYARSPRVIDLPPGKYVVKARARDYLRVEVPVVVVAGRVTRVHLDGNWNPTDAQPSQLVSLPSGTPVGWKPTTQ